ncbi:MAG: elongation factor Ts [Clostridium sp.]|nr:elongation factor Ts [Clostridium sp.]
MFKASDVKELRERTGAGMLDCKKALDACEGDMDKAIDWLREKGISKAAKKEGRIAAEGVCVVKAEGSNAVILEVNSETDFVAQNKEFLDFTNYLADVLLKNDATTVEDALKINDGGETIGDKLINLTAKIGEKLSLRRFEKVTKTDDEVFGTYTHMGGKIGSLVVLKGANSDVAKDVCMHIAAMAPVCLNKEDVPADMIDHEKTVITEQVMNEGKPQEIALKMVNGRINKFYKEICLADQEFIKDSSVNVSTYVKNNGGEIVKFVRFAVGEGIEKKEEDFAQEVMNQVNGN